MLVIRRDGVQVQFRWWDTVDLKDEGLDYGELTVKCGPDCERHGVAEERILVLDRFQDKVKAKALYDEINYMLREKCRRFEIEPWVQEYDGTDTTEEGVAMAVVLSLGNN